MGLNRGDQKRTRRRGTLSSALVLLPVLLLLGSSSTSYPLGSVTVTTTTTWTTTIRPVTQTLPVTLESISCNTDTCVVSPTSTGTLTQTETASAALTLSFTATYTTSVSSLAFYSSSNAITSNPSAVSTAGSQSGAGPKCVIATAAYGSSLAGPVQFLREFRNEIVNRTALGSAFLSAFNGWYYSWAPDVARVESTSNPLRAAVRVLIIPLIGSLFVAQAAFETIRPLNPEVAILLAGSLAAAMIGTIYLAPLAYVVLRRVKLRRRRILAYTSGLALGLALFGTMSNGSTGFWQIATSVLVLEIILITPVWIVTSFRRVNICNSFLTRE